MVKTNVIRLLEQAKINFQVMEYEYDESDLSGTHAADAMGIPREQVFKTLVTRGAGKKLYVFCLPVNTELNLKKAAKITGEKNIEMVHVKEIQELTGYIRGGCSPIGMRKKYPTVIDETALLYDSIGVSAGARGIQIMLSPDDLISYIQAEVADITD
jgi:Cys-tRNA(Pro)/Cys-tRNA(Cys) deacylase